MIKNISTCLRAAMLLTGAAFVFDIPSDFFGLAIWQEQIGLVMIGLVCADIFLTLEPSGKPRTGITGAVARIDLALAACTLILCTFATWRFETLVAYGYLDNPQGLFIAIVLIAMICESTRRSCGWPLLILLGTFLLYGLTANRFSGMLEGRAVDPYELFTYTVLDPGGLLGTPLAVVTTTVLAFVVFGAALFCLGGGKLFLDLALAMMRGIPGGAGKGAIVASTLFGTISGSAVSNVVTTGIVTIPMMKRSGYDKNEAGAIEAVASTGGQILPPIMGSAAFIMADTLSISYQEVVKAALLPGLLYYFTLFLQVHLRAARQKLRPIEASDMPEPAVTLRAYWPFLIPLLLLVWLLFGSSLPPHKIAFTAAAACLVAAWFTPTRPDLGRLRAIIDTTGAGMVSIVPAVCIAGLIVGVLSITGLGFTFGLGVVDQAGDNLLLLLVLTALASLILGMGLPTTAVYIVMAGLVAPALVTAGIPELAAHLFVFYYGVLSMITPPVCLAAIAAAAIAGGGFMQTGFASMKLALTGFVVPFLFVLRPELLSLDLAQASWWSSLLVSLAGFVLLAAASEGYLIKTLSGTGRTVSGLAGISLFAALLVWS